jgi:hypothetical protein
MRQVSWRGALAVVVLSAGGAMAEEGPVIWTDESCGYFIIQMPEGNPSEAFGLFSAKTKPMPKLGDVLEGDILSSYEIDVTEKTSGTKYGLLHWANAKTQEMLVRNTPVQCASRWKKKK